MTYVLSRSAIVVQSKFLVASRPFLYFSVAVGAFAIGLSQMSSFLSQNIIYPLYLHSFHLPKRLFPSTRAVAAVCFTIFGSMPPPLHTPFFTSPVYKSEK